MLVLKVRQLTYGAYPGKSKFESEIVIIAGQRTTTLRPTRLGAALPRQKCRSILGMTNMDPDLNFNNRGSVWT